MFISAMNVVIVISFLIGSILYYMSSSSTGASAAAKGDAAFRGFSNGIFLHEKIPHFYENYLDETKERSFQLLSLVNTAIHFYKELNSEQQD